MIPEEAFSLLASNEAIDCCCVPVELKQLSFGAPSLQGGQQHHLKGCIFWELLLFWLLWGSCIGIEALYRVLRMSSFGV